LEPDWKMLPHDYAAVIIACLTEGVQLRPEGERFAGDAVDGILCGKIRRASMRWKPRCP
jgi:hypothetical protein